MRKLFLFAAGLLAPVALAQNTDLEGLGRIIFNFGNPGARSMGMGGAFLGLADDASAAEANPAGLTILRTPEISLEVRHYRHFIELPIAGIFPDLVFEEFSSPKATEIQFASIVIPIKNFAFAAYYHQPLNYQMTWEMLPGEDRFGRLRNVPQFYIPRGNPPGSAPPITKEECLQLPPGECLVGSVLPFVSQVQIELETFGIAGAVKMGQFSLGGSVRYHAFEESAFTLRYFQDSLAEVAAQATDLDLASAEPGIEHNFTVAAGFKWAISEKFSVGGVFKQGPEFDAPLYYLDILGEDETFDQLADTTFHVPDLSGLGVSFRPLPELIFNLDAVYVAHSNLVDDFVPGTFGTALVEQPFEAEDVIEIHVGGEYFFPTTIPLGIRVGWWRDPAHSMHYVGPITCQDPEFEDLERVICTANRITAAMLFPGGKDLDHYSIGMGLAWPDFQIDAAYSTSEGFKVGSLSGVYRF